MTEGRGSEVKTVSLTIDGKRIEAAAGTTILEAARNNGIDIPTLCYHPRLRPLGHCRLCVVEVEGVAAPLTSCDHPVQEGMVVTTSTPKLEGIRREIISLMLSDHPYEDCLTCEKSGDCDLQEKTYSWQIELPALLRQLPVSDDENPYIVRDEAKCVLCGRCYRVCLDYAGRNVFGMIGNGIETRITPVQLDESEAPVPVTLEEAGCIFCGQCVDVCPVGALTERERFSVGREWELTAVSGVCLECSLGCPVERHFADNRLARVTAEFEGEPGGWLCRKGKFTAPVDGENGAVLTAPLLRGEDGLTEVSYDRALQETARAFAKIKERKGPGALAVLAGGRCSNEESFLLQKLAREAMGTAHLDLGVKAGWARALRALEKAAGPAVRGPSIDDFAGAGAIFVLGEGLSESNPVAAMAVERACRLGSAVLVQVGTDERTITAWDRLVLLPRPGEEASFFEALTALLQGKPAAEEAAGLGLDEAALSRAAELFKGPAPVVLVSPSFFSRGEGRWIEPLLEAAKAAGQLAQGKSSLLFLAEEGNARGILETGGAPDGEQAAGETALDRAGILAAVESGAIKGLFASLEGLSEPFPPGLEFLAVQCYSKSEIPAEADVIFPALPARLKEGTFTNSAGLEQQNLSGAANGLWPGWQVVASLIRAMGASAECGSLQEVQEEIRRIAAGR